MVTAQPSYNCRCSYTVNAARFSPIKVYIHTLIQVIIMWNDDYEGYEQIEGCNGMI